MTRSPPGADDLEDGRAARDYRITSACGCQPSCRLRPDKAGEQAVDFARFFHLRQVAGFVEDVHRQATGERLGMGERDDAVVAAPDDLHRHFQMERDFGDPFALNAVGKPFAREGFERRLHAVEPLVAQDILDHRAAEERWVLDEPPWPGKSSAIVRRVSARAGWLNIQALRSAPKPCTKRTGTASPAPRSRTRSRLPPASMSRGAGPASSAAVSAAGSGATKPATKASISASGTSAGAATASSAPIGNVAPACATMRRNVPPSEASKTLVIFVVSISRSSSPGLKLSPACFSQPRIFPSVIVRPHFGIVIGVIALLISESFLRPIRSSSGAISMSSAERLCVLRGAPFGRSSG